MANEQNTVSGGGESLFASTGNSALDLIQKLGAVGVSIADSYQDYQDRVAARKIELSNALSAAQTPTAALQNAVSSNDINADINKLFLYGIGFIAIGALSIYALKVL